MARISIGDCSLAVNITGTGKPLLLVHGFPLDHTMWRGQLAGLAEHYQVIAPDLRGFGQSDAATGVLSMQGHADDLAKLLEALKIAGPVTLCGLSMGGYIAWQFAARHRSKLEKLIVADTKAAADAPEAAATRLKTAASVLQQGSKLVADGMLPKLFPKELIEAQAEIVQQTYKVLESTRPETIAWALQGMAERPDMISLLPRLDLPTLVLCGQHDVIVTSAEMQALAQNLPQGKFVEIAAAGHMAPLEKPVEANRAIAAFMG